MEHTLKESERTVPVIMYTPMRMTWGKLVYPEIVRPQIWLKMPLAPEYFRILDSNTLLFGGRQPIRMSAPEALIPISQILAYHVQPPFEVELDYDPDEPNRAMKQLAVSVDIFRFEGKIRISTAAEFAASIQGIQNTFRSFYDVTVRHPTAPEIKPLSVPMALIRADHMLYMIEE